MAKKNVTYRVFIIKNEELTHDATDLKDVLRTAEIGILRRGVRRIGDKDIPENA